MRAAVLGATGYAGQEVVKILMRHPELSLVAVTSEREAGELTSVLFPSLRNGPRTYITGQQLEGESLDVVISCQAPKQATGHFGAWLARGAKIMDLSADFRLSDVGAYESAYGPHPAPELMGQAQSGYADDPAIHYGAGRNIFGNPGCYPTAFYAAAGPLCAAGVSLPYVIVDGKSGMSGAGRKPQVDMMMAEMAENVAPYNVPGKHRHTLEMQAATGGAVVFQPHYMPMARGMSLTIYLPNAPVSPDDVADLWHEAYGTQPFVDVLDAGQLPSTRRVRNTNRLEIAVSSDDRTGTVVLYSALDNLVKGAAGQAVQHLNQWLGWPASLGLE
jgi:N-acetyl-gamma-glutamyl-phosphate reductase